MKEMDKEGIREDVGKLKQGVPEGMDYNPGRDNGFFLPVGGGANRGMHPAKKQGDTLRYIRPE